MIFKKLMKMRMRKKIEYYNGNGDFKNNDKNYNSSDFNNNLLPNQTHQTNNGL